MSWSDVYLFCFIVGVALSVFSFMAGAIHLHLPFHMHLPFHGTPAHAHGGSHGGGTHISWFNASTGLAFLAWFGGVDYLMTKYSHVQPSLWLVFSAATTARRNCTLCSASDRFLAEIPAVAIAFLPVTCILGGRSYRGHCTAKYCHGGRTGTIGAGRLLNRDNPRRRPPCGPGHGVMHAKPWRTSAG